MKNTLISPQPSFQLLYACNKFNVETEGKVTDELLVDLCRQLIYNVEHSIYEIPINIFFGAYKTVFCFLDLALKVDKSWLLYCDDEDVDIQSEYGNIVNYNNVFPLNEIDYEMAINGAAEDELYEEIESYRLLKQEHVEYLAPVLYDHSTSGAILLEEEVEADLYNCILQENSPVLDAILNLVPDSHEDNVGYRNVNSDTLVPVILDLGGGLGEFYEWLKGLSCEEKSRIQKGYNYIYGE